MNYEGNQIQEGVMITHNDTTNQNRRALDRGPRGATRMLLNRHPAISDDNDQITDWYMFLADTISLTKMQY